MLVDNKMLQLMKGYQAKVNFNGKTEAERNTNRLIEARREFLQVSPTGQVILHNGVERLVHITDRSHINKTIRDKYVYFEPNVTVLPGDFIYWNDKHYMVDEVEDPVVKNDTGVTIIPLNEMLTWQDESGIIYQIPCRMEDLTSLYSDGVTTTGQMVSLPIDQVVISVQKNDFTDQLELNHRLIFGKSKRRKFEIQRRIFSSTPGILRFALKRSLYSEDKDRVEYNLANFIPITKSISDETINGETKPYWGEYNTYTLPEGYRSTAWWVEKIDSNGNNITRKGTVDVNKLSSNEFSFRVNSIRELGTYRITSKVIDSDNEEKTLTLEIKVRS